MGCLSPSLMMSGFICRQLPIGLLPNAFSGILAPLDAGKGIIIDSESAPAAVHRDIVREDLDLFAALGTLFYGKSRGADV